MLFVVSSVWRIFARVRGADAASAVFSLLDEMASAVSAFETAPQEWCLEAYPQSPALTADRAAQLALAAAGAAGALLEVTEEKLPERNWLVENQLAFPPLRVGRFFIFGSHHRGRVPGGSIGILIDAATAFGTGEHPSTRGCLMALDRLARRRRFHHPLDIGTGTGILSIAAAKLLHREVLAGDIDQDAVKVTRHNVGRNGVTRLVRVRRARGYCDRAIGKARYDLILSNILARPLAVLARELASALAPGGRAVLSGLLRRQEAIVLAPHRGFGIVLEYRVTIDGWSTLVMRRAGMAMGAEAPILESNAIGRILRLPSGGRAYLPLETGSAARKAQACKHRRRGPRFANGGFRYRQASDRRAPSARHRLAPGAATRKRTFRPR